MKRVLSVNVGLPRQVRFGKQMVLTSIFKHPVAQRVAVKPHNLDGDKQSDLTVHGGPYKAVYSYPSEHYSFWKAQLQETDLPFAAFGENLTTEGLLESEVCIGDQFRVGTVVLQVTQPRMPCFKLGIRFGRTDIVKRFWESGKPGIYFSIVTEGELGMGDSIELLARDPRQVSVLDIVHLFRGDSEDIALLDRALQTPLYGGWKQRLYELRSEL